MGITREGLETRALPRHCMGHPTSRRGCGGPFLCPKKDGLRSRSGSMEGEFEMDAVHGISKKIRICYRAKTEGTTPEAYKKMNAKEKINRTQSPFYFSSTRISRDFLQTTRERFKASEQKWSSTYQAVHLGNSLPEDPVTAKSMYGFTQETGN